MGKIIYNSDRSITRVSSTGRKFTYKRNFGQGGDTTQPAQPKKVNTLEGDLFSKVLMNRNKNLDFVQRAYALGEIPETPMFNTEDKTEYNNPEEVPYKISMSHKMAYDWDKSGQTYIFPSIYNPTKESIKVPNQYADYISNQGYKKATEMNKFQQGGETESQKQKRLYEEMQKLPDPKISEDTHYDEVRKEWVPSMKAKSDTLFVSNPNDPRLKAYEDSLKLWQYNQAPKGIKIDPYFAPDSSLYPVGKDLKGREILEMLPYRKEPIEPVGQYKISSYNPGKESVIKKTNEVVSEGEDAVQLVYPKPTQPVAYREDKPKPIIESKEDIFRKGHWRDEKGNYWARNPEADDYKAMPFSTPLPTKPASQIPTSFSLQPKGQVETPQYKIPKPDIKRKYYEENGKYYMDFPDSKSKNQTIKRPISKETYRLGLQEQDEDLGIRTRYRNAGRIKKSC